MIEEQLKRSSGQAGVSDGWMAGGDDAGISGRGGVLSIPRIEHDDIEFTTQQFTGDEHPDDAAADDDDSFRLVHAAVHRSANCTESTV